MRLFEGTPFDRPPTCERCGQLESNCTCPPLAPPRIPPEKQTARLSVEKRKKYHPIELVEIEINRPRGFLDYAFEDLDVFDDARRKAEQAFQTSAAPQTVE